MTAKARSVLRANGICGAIIGDVACVLERGHDNGVHEWQEAAWADPAVRQEAHAVMAAVADMIAEQTEYRTILSGAARNLHEAFLALTKACAKPREGGHVG